MRVHALGEAICDLIGRLNPQQLIAIGSVVLCRLLTIDPKTLPHSCEFNPKTLVLTLPGNFHIEMFHQRHTVTVPDMLHCSLACWVPFSHGSDLAHSLANSAPKVVAMLNCTLESISLGLECSPAHPLQSARSKSQKMELVSLSAKTRCTREVMKSTLLGFEAFFIGEACITEGHDCKIVPVHPSWPKRHFEIDAIQSEVHNLVCLLEVLHRRLDIATPLKTVHSVSQVGPCIPGHPSQASCHRPELCQFLLSHSVCALAPWCDCNVLHTPCVVCRIDVDGEVWVLREPSATVTEVALLHLTNGELCKQLPEVLLSLFVIGHKEIINVRRKHADQPVILASQEVQCWQDLTCREFTVLDLEVHAQVETAPSIHRAIYRYTAYKASLWWDVWVGHAALSLRHQHEARCWRSLEIRICDIAGLHLESLRCRPAGDQVMRFWLRRWRIAAHLFSRDLFEIAAKDQTGFVFWRVLLGAPNCWYFCHSVFLASIISARCSGLASRMSSVFATFPVPVSSAPTMRCAMKLLSSSGSSFLISSMARTSLMGSCAANFSKTVKPVQGSASTTLPTLPRPTVFVSDVFLWPSLKILFTVQPVETSKPSGGGPSNFGWNSRNLGLLWTRIAFSSFTIQ